MLGYRPAMSAAPLALVTGGSSGIGRALAAELVDRGHDVVLAAQDGGVAAVGDELSGPTQVRSVQCDLRTREGVGQLVEALDGVVPDVLCLNAGVDRGGRFVETALQDHLDLVDLNVVANVALAHLLLPAMVQRGSGRVLFTASIAAVAPGPFQTTYSASKAFVHSFAGGLRHELRGTGVTVTSMLPGPTATAIFARAGMLDTFIGTRAPKDSPERVARDGVDAALAGRRQVVPGSIRNAVQVHAARFLPTPVTTFLAGKQAEPGTG